MIGGVEDTVLPTVPPGEPLSNAEVREAVRSLKGSVLRTEVYALDTRTQRSTNLGYRMWSPSKTCRSSVEIRQGEAKNAVFFYPSTRDDQSPS